MAFRRSEFLTVVMLLPCKEMAPGDSQEPSVAAATQGGLHRHFFSLCYYGISVTIPPYRGRSNFAGVPHATSSFPRSSLGAPPAGEAPKMRLMACRTVGLGSARAR